MTVGDAIKRLITYERSLWRQYRQYAGLTSNEECKELFLQMAAEQEKHLLKLRKLADKYCPT